MAYCVGSHASFFCNKYLLFSGEKSHCVAKVDKLRDSGQVK